VPVVNLRRAVAKSHTKTEAEHFIGALMLELPDLARDLATKMYSNFVALRDRDIYRGQREYAVGAI
jgi:hypothetical protein